MEYQTLGRTGMKVSRLGFGGAPIGLQDYLTPGDRDSDQARADARQAVRDAVARGINYFDTAPGYGSGRSERLIGEALEPVRDKVFIATKYVFHPDEPVERHTERLKESLERLRTDYVDVLQFHGSTFPDDRAEEVVDAGILDWARQMQAGGLCRFTGITAENASGGLERLLNTGKVDVLEIAYNVIYQCACDHQRAATGIVPFARALGMGVTTMRTTTCLVLPRLVRMAIPDADVGKLVRLAINFVLSTPEIDCALVGMRTPDEVRMNADLADDTSARIDMKALHERYV